MTAVEGMLLNPNISLLSNALIFAVAALLTALTIAIAYALSNLPFWRIARLARKQRRQRAKERER